MRKQIGATMESRDVLNRGPWYENKWWLIVLIIAFFAAPLVFGEFYLTVLCEALVMSMLALSFNLLFGFMGQLSFGQAAFFGLGGYGVALLMTKAHVNFWLSIAAGVLVAAVVGLIVGFFCVRLRGIYFAILTLAFGQLVFFIIFKWHNFTGGDDGIQGVFPPSYLKSPVNYYYFILLVFLGSTYLLRRIVRSPFGQIVKGMRENTIRTEFLGIHIAKYQLIAFVIAAALAGLAGAIWVPFYRSVAPSYLTWIKSGEPVMAAILGGPSLFLGPVLGMFIMTFFHAWVLGFTVYWPVVMGALILAIIFFLPGGILGFLQEKLKERETRKQRGDSDEFAEDAGDIKSIR
ncbi:MAG: branched-chain amino acid ABC transporter permease [Deltaproteobacteria bacterium HGW-Deltaproteobacteria-21]|nr:MAG: branched-chain amino acid ABC transporter permease [Deltaproteobacteria bacterium HGW-Deltaproteobacteria-21]